MHSLHCDCDCYCIVAYVIAIGIVIVIVQGLPGSHSLHRDCDHHLDQHLATPQAIYHQKLIIESETILKGQPLTI